MKTPDKVYVFCDYAGNPDKVDIYPIGDHSTKYIRKDALLEWAKERYQQTISNVGCYTGHSVWEEVIEHIEAL